MSDGCFPVANTVGKYRSCLDEDGCMSDAKSEWADSLQVAVRS